jgi:DNA uptake protein ComE-like DNA-binding protein
MRDFLRQFLLYSRSERRAVITLAVLIIIVVIAPKAYHFYASPTIATNTDTTFTREITQWQKDNESPIDTTSDAHESEPVASNAKATTSAHTAFYFDPNTIGIPEWQRLGLSEKQAAVIEKYKSKGGKFRKADDLRRIYVLSDAEKDRLVPYVRIAGEEAASKSKSSHAGSFYTIEINTADSAAYEALWGIGPVLSARIVKYRGLLGGFHSVEQVGEVYGIRDSVFMDIRPHLTVNAALVHKLNINEADYETLKKHPYLHAKLAKAIVGYRANNGKFESLDQLKEFKAVTDEVYEKITPYLTL